MLDFSVEKYYISDQLSVDICTAIPNKFNKLFRFEVTSNVETAFNFIENARRKYLLELSFADKSRYDHYANNQSITDLFELIIHSNSNLCESSTHHIFTLDFEYPFERVTLDYNKHEFCAFDSNNNKYIILENLKYHLIKNLHKKLKRLTGCLK